MSDFKQRKIRLSPKRKPISEKAKQHIATALGIILLFFAVYYAGAKLVEKLSGSALIQFFAGFVGKDLAVDEKNHTNILLLGVGGGEHEGKDLTDTIIVASIDHASNHVSFLSIPRDLYVESSLGADRINGLYEKGKTKWNSSQGLDFLKTTVENSFKIPLHYILKVDFAAFEKAVDAMDGIDIYVENAINDPEYPNDKTFGYDPFLLAKGNRHLDGKTTLKYVRSRKSTSDFDRSKRQQQVLVAIKKKAAEKSSFSRNSLLKQLFYSLDEHVETTMSLREMLSLADFGVNWDSSNMGMSTFNDEPLFRGGFLYTPLRELYGGAFVLLPASDNFDNVRLFTQLVLYGPYDINKFPVSVLNGTKQAGLAATAYFSFQRFGIETSKTGNAKSQNLEQTTLYMRDQSAAAAAEFLQKMIPGAIVNQIPSEYADNPKFAQAKIILELGADSKTYVSKLDIFKNVVSMVSAASNTGSSSTAAAEPSSKLSPK